MTRTATIALALLFAGPGHALAHDQQAHGRPATHGSVASVNGDQLTLTTATGPVAVSLTDTTKIERAGKDVGREALTAGKSVVVFGTTVPHQGVVAREVVLEEDAAETKPHDEHPNGH